MAKTQNQQPQPKILKFLIKEKQLDEARMYIRKILKTSKARMIFQTAHGKKYPELFAGKNGEATSPAQKIWKHLHRGRIDIILEILKPLSSWKFLAEEAGSLAYRKTGLTLLHHLLRSPYYDYSLSEGGRDSGIMDIKEAQVKLIRMALKRGLDLQQKTQPLGLSSLDVMLIEGNHVLLEEIPELINLYQPEKMITTDSLRAYHDDIHHFMKPDTKQAGGVMLPSFLSFSKKLGSWNIDDNLLMETHFSGLKTLCILLQARPELLKMKTSEQDSLLSLLKENKVLFKKIMPELLKIKTCLPEITPLLNEITQPGKNRPGLPLWTTMKLELLSILPGGIIQGLTCEAQHTQFIQDMAVKAMAEQALLERSRSAKGLGAAQKL